MEHPRARHLRSGSTFRLRSVTFRNGGEARTNQQDGDSACECSKLEQQIQAVHSLSPKQARPRLAELLRFWR